MAIPERDPLYSTDGTTRTSSSSVYTRDSNATGWFVGIIVALALIAIGYLVFSANSGPSTSTTDTTINNTPAVTAPAPADSSTTPMTSTTPDTSITPAAPAPDTSVTPAAPDASTAPAAPADTMAPATPAAPATPVAPAQ